MREDRTWEELMFGKNRRNREPLDDGDTLYVGGDWKPEDAYGDPDQIPPEDAYGPPDSSASETYEYSSW
jgi:hypothetical protein